jgi:hypothetical protein
LHGASRPAARGRSPVPSVQYLPHNGPLPDEVTHGPNRDRLFLDVEAELRPACQANVVNPDIDRSVSTDVIPIAEDMPFADGHFDFALCFATLERVIPTARIPDRLAPDPHRHGGHRAGHDVWDCPC